MSTHHYGLMSAALGAAMLSMDIDVRGRPLTPREAVPKRKGHKRKFKGSKAAKRQSRGKR